MRHLMPDRLGWSSSQRSRFGSRAVLLLIALATFSGMFASATPRTVRADELSDAYAKQQALQKLIAGQKSAITELNANQASLASMIATTKDSLSQINANLLTVKTQIVGMTVDIAKSQNSVDELSATEGRLDAELAQIQGDAETKAAELESSKALLASRIREAYDTDRTSMLETMLSGQDFTDVLTEVGYHLDFAEQDKVLAEQIQSDQAILEILRGNVELARQQTADLHALATSSRKELDAQLAELASARKELARLEAETARLLKTQQSAYARMAADKRKLGSAVAAAEKSRKVLEAMIAKLVRDALEKGGIPSAYNGTFQWPLDGRITQEFGCTGFSWEPAVGSCAHFHRGIDIANVMYTPIYAAGDGKVIFAGRSPYDPAWIVIIAHSEHLVTWYGHIDNKSHAPVVRAGQYVTAGQLIAYEGMTGNTTGPHLHWAVQLDGNWVNPRLFLPR
jgi:murein DD-endopeptidase MepM/ murein hydrolase activator NlpD